MKRRILGLLLDLLIAGLLILLVWIFCYRMPQAGTRAVSAISVTENTASSSASATTSLSAGAAEELPSVAETTEALQQVPQSALLLKTQQKKTTEDWKEKFADKFTDTVVSTDQSYTSPDLSITLRHFQYDTGILDTADNGNHEKYGTGVAYTVADIYISDITCFQTAFARDMYGIGYSEKLTDMSARLQSVLAVNGDSYSNDRHKNNGTIIRNGVIYRNNASDAEMCVLNWDGTMDIYKPGLVSADALIQKGAYQSWIFGPSLLDADGKAKTRASDFKTWDYIRQSHPRTAIGYYEPGHYCLLLADGRQKTSRGLFLEEEAKIFEQLGCRSAYNLDGGHCSFMTLLDQVVSHPYKPEHEIPDGIFITEKK